MAIDTYESLIERARGLNSPWNLQTYATPVPALPDTIYLRDLTLRQAAGMPAPMTLAEKLDFLAALDGAGVHESYIGFLESSDWEELAAAARKRGLSIKIGIMAFPFGDVWQENKSRLKRAGELLDFVIVCGYAIPHRMSWDEMERGCMEALDLSRASGVPTVVYGLGEATKAPVDHLVTAFRAGIDAGADRILVNDSTGVIRPDAMRHAMSQIQSALNVPMEVHCHNDFGLATANALASLEAGVQVIECLPNGSDPERCGNVPLEQLVMSLLLQYDRKVGVDPQQLLELSRLSAEVTGIAVWPMQPIVGSRQFSRYVASDVRYFREAETVGVGLADPGLASESHLPFPAALAGQEQTLALGRQASNAAFREKFEQLGVEVTEAYVRDIADMGRALAEEKRGYLTDDEVLALVKKVAG